MWPGIATDKLGDCASIAVDPAIYGEDVIFKAAYWFTDRFYVFLDRQADGRILVELRAKDGDSKNLEGACADFCNSLIDFRVRGIVAKETTPIREALVTKAFLEGVPKPGLSGAKSDERHLDKR